MLHYVQNFVLFIFLSLPTTFAVGATEVALGILINGFKTHLESKKFCNNILLLKCFAFTSMGSLVRGGAKNLTGRVHKTF